VLGFAASRLVATIDDFLVEITITVALAYGAYLLADQVGLSGIIATVVAGITLGNYGKRIGMSERTREAVSVFWGVVAFVLTALVFLLVGVAIRLDALLEATSAVLWAALAILVARAFAVYGMVGSVGAALRGAGRATMPLGWLHVTFWAGLRGAVAVALALSLPADIPQRQLLQEIVFGVVLITILVQGTTVPFVVGRALGTAPE
jgi:CPA1 family monovalent cation:H+ antiporter